MQLRYGILPLRNISRFSHCHGTTSYQLPEATEAWQDALQDQQLIRRDLKRFSLPASADWLFINASPGASEAVSSYVSAQMQVMQMPDKQCDAFI